jgi:hypothetical protein
MCRRYHIGTLIGDTLVVKSIQASHPGDELVELSGRVKWRRVEVARVEALPNHQDEPQKMRVCAECGIEKPYSQFWVTGKNSTPYRRCGKCMYASKKAKKENLK